MKNTLKAYKYVNWFYPIGRKLFPNGFSKLEEIGDSMISVSLHGYDGWILNGKEITETAANL